MCATTDEGPGFEAGLHHRADQEHVYVPTPVVCVLLVCVYVTTGGLAL
jgi:hypothetical protein